MGSMMGYVLGLGPPLAFSLAWTWAWARDGMVLDCDVGPAWATLHGAFHSMPSLRKFYLQVFCIKEKIKENKK